MSLIDTTFFRGDISIPQLAGDEAVEDIVNDTIAKYETAFLSDLLGYAFQKLVVASPATAPFLAIVQGDEYTDRHGVLRMWTGLANSTTKSSPIAQYIFYQYIREQHEVKTRISTVKPKAENATRVAPEYTLNKAWNDMHKMIVNLREFMHAKAADYPQYKPHEVKCFRRSNRFF